MTLRSQKDLEKNREIASCTFKAILNRKAARKTRNVRNVGFKALYKMVHQSAGPNGQGKKSGGITGGNAN